MEEDTQGENILLKTLLNIESTNKTILEKFQEFALNQHEQKNTYTKNSNDLAQSQTEFIKWRDTQKREFSQIFTYEKDQLNNLFDAKSKQIGNIKVGLYEPTQQNIKRLENFIKRFWMVPVILLFISMVTAGATTYLAVNFYKESIKPKQEIISDYTTELLKENAIVSKDDEKSLSDMIKWFKKTPNNRNAFNTWKKKNK